MSLWVDKHRPRSLDKLDFHEELNEKLRLMVTGGDFPHMLWSGPPGAGKKTRIVSVLREIYGASIDKVKIEHKTFKSPSNASIELTTLSSAHHIEINPSDAGFYDRVVVQEVIKELAQSQTLDSSLFKVVVLQEVDRMTKDAQHALRRTMEKYMTACRLILCCNSTSKVIEPVRSRCLHIRVPAPSEQDIVAVLAKVCKREGLNLPEELGARLAQQSDRNLRRALLMLEATKVKQYPFVPGQVIELPDWEIFLSQIASDILANQDAKTLLSVRGKLYELLSHCIPADVIMKKLSLELLGKLDASLSLEVIECAAFYEHRLQQGSKPIFHLEAFITKFMIIYKQFLTSAAGDWGV